MARGGKRSGAGRPPGTRALRYVDEIAIGGNCERLWREAWENNTTEASNEYHGRLRRHWERIKRIPLSKRRGWLKSEDYQDHQDDIKDALREAQDLYTDDSAEYPDPARVVVIEGTRPKGIKNEITEKIAAQHGISPRKAQECWDKFRAFEKSSK